MAVLVRKAKNANAKDGADYSAILAKFETDVKTVDKITEDFKTMSGDELVNEKVILMPVTSAHGYRDIVIEDDDLHDLRVVGEFVAVLA